MITSYNEEKTILFTSAAESILKPIRSLSAGLPAKPRHRTFGMCEANHFSQFATSCVLLPRLTLNVRFCNCYLVVLQPSGLHERLREHAM